MEKNSGKRKGRERGRDLAPLLEELALALAGHRLRLLLLFKLFRERISMFLSLPFCNGSSPSLLYNVEFRHCNLIPASSSLSPSANQFTMRTATLKS